MPRTFNVASEIDLGNATWSARLGDTVVLTGDKYGLVPVKQGVNYRFTGNASAGMIAGLGLFDGPWSASSVQMGSCEIENPRVNPENINCHYVFTLKLPVNSRFPAQTRFVHTNGAIVSFLGNDREGFSLGSGPADAQLPKAVVQVHIAVTDQYDVGLSDEHSWLQGELEGIAERRSAAEPHIDARKRSERLEENYKLGLRSSEMQYKAQWAVNDLLREYTRITEQHNVDRFSVAKFSDGLGFAIVKNGTDEVFNESFRSSIDKFSNVNLSESAGNDLQVAMLEGYSATLRDMVLFHLERLEYHFAVAGMYQEFEAALEMSGSPGKKWEFIEGITNDQVMKVALAEMINARNHVVHGSVLQTGHTQRNVLKYGAQPLNQYEIYALKKPWVWHGALRRFLIDASLVQTCQVGE